MTLLGPIFEADFHENSYAYRPQRRAHQAMETIREARLSGRKEIDCDRAYKVFFAKRAEFLRFKRKGSGDSFCYPDSKQITLEASQRIFLPKLGWVRYYKSQNIEGTLRNGPSQRRVVSKRLEEMFVPSPA
ncbi:MAG: hypothetical protein A3F67_11440 [Verrucomicrobia bacterium RIFCSPHIGHO2_12_FULL_41_10]|nr:MAG: hypothetical protein A3F67_11440 [Verrucomicrobia bacterium RIFCSPHIGHO2_12_FULL_41_10]